MATGLSRIAGLVREVVAASYFGTSGAASAFTLAFQIPNLIRALVADAALSSAFVPVFSDLLEHKRRRVQGVFPHGCWIVGRLPPAGAAQNASCRTILVHHSAHPVERERRSRTHH